MNPDAHTTMKAAALLGVTLLLSVYASADWPQFQGPNRNGASPETGLARSWPEAGPKILWSLPLAPGYGAPAVKDGEVFILDRTPASQDVLRCVELNTGKECWTYSYDAPGSISHDGTRATPTVDDNYVFTVGMLGHFNCIDRKTHQPVWTKNLVTDFKLEVPTWGIVQEPLLYKDLVIVAPQAQDAYVVAYKRDTGDMVWKSSSLGLVGYSTPVLATLGGVEQLVMVGACKKGGSHPGKVGGISLADGSILWTYDGFQCSIPIPYPTPLPEDRLFITGGYGAGSAMVQVKQDAGKFAVAELFTTKECGSQTHQPLLHEGCLYLNSNSNEREDGMVCLGLDGTTKWKTKGSQTFPTFERGNMLLVDGLILNFDGKRGTLHLVQPSPDAYKELAQAKVFTGKEMWAPMALSDGKLLLRSQNELKCIDVKNP